MPRLIIIGGGTVGEHLMGLLPNAVVIELNQARVENLRKRFGKERVFSGPGANRTLLERAGIKEASAIIICESFRA